MPDQRQVPDQPLDQLALHPLDVIAIELEADVRLPHLADDVEPELQAIQEVPRALPHVEHLDEERDAGLAREGRRALQVLHRRAAQDPLGHAGRAISRQDVEPAAAHRARHGDRVLDRRVEMVAPGRIAEIAAVAGREVPALGVEQHQLESVPAELPLDGARVHVVDEQELHRAEARGRGLLEALQEGHLVEQHREVRGVADHRSLASSGRCGWVIAGRSARRIQGARRASASAFSIARRRATSGGSCRSQARVSACTAA